MLKSLIRIAGVAMILAAVMSCKKEPEFGPANIGVGTGSVEFTKDGGEEVINLLSNRNWTAELTSSEGKPEWLKLSDTVGVASNDSVAITFTALPNTGEDRYATVTFSTGTLTATVSVSQPGEIAKQYTPISDVRALYQGENVTVTEDWTICGTVISNYRHENSGGLNNATSQKTVIVQDETGGISLYLAENNTLYAVGDKVEIKVKDLELQRYQNGSLQLNAVPMDRLTKLTGGSQVEPKSITAAELLTGNYESQYVAVSNVQVMDSDLGKTFVSGDSHTSINFIAETGERFVLFSSKYSTFGAETVPSGSGVLKGIAAVYGGTTYQISITSTDDYAGLTGERFDQGEIPTEGKLVGNYNTWKTVGPLASFKDDFESITEGYKEYVNDNWMFWTSDGASVKTGFKTEVYDNDGSKYISIAPFESTTAEVVAYALPPRADMTKADPKEFSFSKALYYRDSDDGSKLEVVVSTDFAGDFEKATWTVVKDATFASGATTNQWVTETVDLSAYSGESSLCIAIRYTGKGNTYRIDNVSYGDENSGGEDPEPGETVSIKSIRDLYKGSNVTISDSWTIKGTVISNVDLNNGSSKKNIVLQDETAGIMVRVKNDEESFKLGDVIEVNIEGQSLEQYNGLLQLNNVPNANITKVSSGSVPEAKAISAAELCTGAYESQYVAVENVQVVAEDLGKTFVVNDSNTSITFESETGETFDLFTSKWAESLKTVTVPEGSGTIKGVAGVNNSVFQLSLTSTSDYAGLTGERFGGGDEPDPEEPVIVKATVAEVLAAEPNDNVWYQMTGTITNIANTTYGNFDITDETGTIYVYGLTATGPLASNDKSFSTLGLKEGDILTFIGTRDEYNGTPQVGGPAYYVSHEEGELPEQPSLITGTEGDGIYTSSVDLSLSSVNAEDQKWEKCKFILGETEYPAIKLGTSSVAGSYSFNLGKTGSVTLTMYAVAWNGKKTHAAVKISGGGTINGLSQVELDCQANAGLSNNSPFTITFGSSDFYTMNIEGATENTVITVTTEGMSNKRVGFTAVNVK